MSIAAVPAYLGQNFKEASPGMRFGMYLNLWGENHEQRRIDWRTADRIWPKEKKHPRWEDRDNKRIALETASRLNPDDKQIIEALNRRQAVMAEMMPSIYSIPSKSIAPFTTGLGNEHPLENGFAFLWPYGIPYLPGSGVKGVLRQAARELLSGLWGESRGWSGEKRYQIKAGGKSLSLSMMDLLFGLESSDGGQEHFRGVLVFWDVIPEIAGGRLMVEIMTPHQTHYYQGNEPPHDSGNPNPISFLTVPPGSKFTFHVLCDTVRLRRIALDLADGDRWRSLLEAAFEHAFDWLGFGAKTAVGYGAMATGEQQHASQGSATLEATLETWEKAKVTYNPGSQELSAVFQSQTALLQGGEAKQLIEAQTKSLQKQLKKGCQLTVRVERMGNRILIRELVVSE